MKRKVINNAAARRRTILKLRQKRIHSRQKQYYLFEHMQD